MLDLMYEYSEIFIAAIVAVLFIIIVITTMIYNPNYSIKEIIKEPSRFFDLLQHSWDRLEKKIDKAQKSAEKVNKKYDKKQKKIKEYSQEINDKYKSDK